MTNMNRVWGSTAGAGDIDEPDPGAVESGHGTVVPPRHNWDNWWQHRADIVLQALQRSSAMEYDAAVPYEAGAIVKFNGSRYLSAADGNLNNTPDVSPGQWFPMPSTGLGPLALVEDPSAYDVRNFQVNTIATAGSNVAGVVMQIPYGPPPFIDISSNIPMGITQYYTVGKTGSGADYESGVMNTYVPNEALAVLMRITGKVYRSTASPANVELRVYMENVTIGDPNERETELIVQYNTSGSETGYNSQIGHAWVTLNPLSPDRMFNVAWNSINGTNHSITMQPVALLIGPGDPQ